jgi:hypothetical protein
MRVVKLALAAPALAIATPALAGFALVPQGQVAVVNKSSLTVAPPTSWNRLKGKVGPQAEAWTLDGLSLNEVVFFTGVANDQTLLKDRAKKDKPLPKFSGSMLAPDVAQLLEQTYRIAVDAPLFEVNGIAPTTFAGHQGFQINYSYTGKGDDVRRKGEATGAIISGRLYMITYAAPEIHYYDRHIGDFRALVKSATLK